MRPLKLQKCYQARFSPDGRFLLSISRDVNLWSLADGKKLWRAHPFSHPADIEFSPDGSKLALKSTSGRIVSLETAAGRLLIDYGNRLEGEGCNACFSASGEELIDGAWSGLLSVRHAHTGEGLFRRHFDGEMICRVLYPSCRSFFITEQKPKATTSNGPPENGYFLKWAWPFESRDPLRLPFSFPFLRSSSLSPCGGKMAVVHGAPPREMVVLNVNSGKKLWSKAVDLGGSGNEICWSSCGSMIAAVQRNRIAIYNAANGSYLGSRHFEFPSSVDFSSDGSLVAFGDWSHGLVETFDPDKLDKDAELPVTGPRTLEELIASLGSSGPARL